MGDGSPKTNWETQGKCGTSRKCKQWGWDWVMGPHSAVPRDNRERAAGLQGQRLKGSGAVHGHLERGHHGIWCSCLQGQDKVRLARPPFRMNTLHLVLSSIWQTLEEGGKTLYKNDIIPPM